MSDTLPFSEAKAYLSELADRVERQHDRILGTRKGRPSFILLSPDDLESLEETLDILKDDDLMESLPRSRRDAEQAKRVPRRDHVWGCWVYKIEITAEGLRHLNKLPDKVRHAALESIFGPISESPNPTRYGTQGWCNVVVMVDPGVAC